MDGRLLVMGLGNTIMGDDGLGVVAMRLLKRKSWPKGISFLEVGASVTSYIEDISRAQKVIVLDAVVAGHPPGTIYRLRDLPERGEGIILTGSHGIGFLEAVALARELTGNPKEVTILGIEPSSSDLGLGLTSKVEAALRRLITLAEAEIASQWMDLARGCQLA